MQKRKRYNSEFKAKVALEAMKEQRTLSELSSEYSIHSNQIADWKKQLASGAKTVFEHSKKIQQSEQKEDKEKEVLYAQIGKLQVELDWLKKKYKKYLESNG
jgi:transposase-like protein